jgi:hypothetical protein
MPVEKPAVKPGASMPDQSAHTIKVVVIED